MNINRRRPKQGEDLILWLSGVLHDAVKDALDGGLAPSVAHEMVLSVARMTGTEAQRGQADTRTTIELSGGERRLIAYALSIRRNLIETGDPVLSAADLERGAGRKGQVRSLDDGQREIIRQIDRLTEKVTAR